MRSWSATIKEYSLPSIPTERANEYEHPQPEYEPARDKTYNRTIRHVSLSKDSGYIVHLPGMARVLVYPSLDSLESVEGTCDKQRLW